MFQNLHGSKHPESKSFGINTMTIETNNLKLIPCDAAILKSAIEGNDKLGKILKAKVPDNWTAFGTDPLKYALHMLTEDAEHTGWLTYFPIIRQENKLIGSGGYKGKPDESGSVELGYEISPEYRNRGFAKEMAVALISNAFANLRVKRITAHTLREVNASVNILSAYGFVKVADVDDPDDGLIWKWMLER
jgi:[ribosomal protein S5]-alanine N-acetyltransferase